MRKNGSRLISLQQYRATDLFLFAVILIAFELILHFAFVELDGDYTFSPLVPIVLLVMMRWGWPSVFYAVGDGILYCILNGGTWQHYIIYSVGNAFIMLLLLMTKFVGKERIAGKWYLSLLFTVAGWLAVVLGRSLVALCFGNNFLTALFAHMSDLFSLAIAIVLILVFRKLDGMFEDQKHFLLRQKKAREEKTRREEQGDDIMDLDEEKLAALRDYNDDMWV